MTPTPKATPEELADLARVGIHKIDLAVSCIDTGNTGVGARCYLKPSVLKMAMEKMRATRLVVEVHPQAIQLPCLFLSTTSKFEKGETQIDADFVAKCGDHNAVVWGAQSIVDTTLPGQVTAEMEKLVDQFMTAMKPYSR